LRQDFILAEGRPPTSGRQCAEVVLKWAATLFAVPLDELNIRVVLAPVELGPYNRHTGYHYGTEHGAFILGNRHIVRLNGGTLTLVQSSGEGPAPEQVGGFLHRMEDFIVHELTHARQAQLLRDHAGQKGWKMKRGAHRDLGWYSAVGRSLPALPRRGTATLGLAHWTAHARRHPDRSRDDALAKVTANAGAIERSAVAKGQDDQST
jgi:hypothetical protein